MTPGSGYPQEQQPGVTMFCGQCGRVVDPAQAFCASCGAPIASAAGTTIGQAAVPPPPLAALPPTAPALPVGTANPAETLTAAPPPPPPSGGWSTSQGSTWQAGMTGMVYAPPATPAPGRPRSRHRVLAVLSAVLLLVTLATTGVWLYRAFAAHQELTAAQYFPRETLFFAGIDTVQAAVNNHHVTEGDLTKGSGQTESLRQQTGLDWQRDIVPWLSRNLAFAAFPRTAPQGAGAGPNANIGFAYLLQSHDDGLAQAAMKKAADFQTQQGHTITKASYGGFTLYSVASASDFASSSAPGAPGVATVYDPGASGAGVTVTAGKGWALIASDPNAAHAVIDRLNGGSGSLSDNSAFTTITRDLPADRFGTFYVDLQGILRTLSGPTAGALHSPLLDSYPTAGGYLEWTAAGLRAQMVLKGQRPGAIGDLSGDTTSLAQLVPASAVAYGGSANLGAAFAASQQLATTATGATTSTIDPFEQLTGKTASSAVFQQPGAVAVLHASSADPQSAPGIVLLLRAPDASAADQLLRSAAAKQGWTLKPVTVAGVSATEIDSASGQPWFQPQSPSSQPPTPAGNGLPTPKAAPIAYAAQVHGTLILTGAQADLAAIINTANGSAPSLAGASRFQQLVHAAPSGASTTVYVDIGATRPANSPAAPSSGADLAARTNALLVTQVWSASELSITADLALQG
jgi:uncharacterized protein DUF3352